MINSLISMISTFVKPWAEIRPATREKWPTTSPSMERFAKGERDDLAWIKFFNHYERHYIALARRLFPNRMQLAEEMFFDHVARIVEDPALQLVTPDVGLRQILVTRYKHEMYDRIRALDSSSDYEKSAGEQDKLDREELSENEQLLRETVMMLHRSFVCGADKGRKSRIRVTNAMRKVWKLHIDDGLRGKEIAERLGISPSLVSNYLDTAGLYMREWAGQFLSACVGGQTRVVGFEWWG